MGGGEGGGDRVLHFVTLPKGWGGVDVVIWLVKRKAAGPSDQKKPY